MACRKKRWLVIGIFCLFPVIFLSSLFVAGWRPRMEKKVSFCSQMKEQGNEQIALKVLQDITCFPVRDDAYTYEDGYGEGRSYGGKRKHEGIDIMAQDGKRGIHQVQSVSQGVVEQLGWLELGGYRVGIRSPQGIYYYYAHLDSYATGLKKGDPVKAGTFLGYMGDTGYGKEGTRGQFPVHLHFGIYYNQGETEKSINPYSALQYLEDAVRFSLAGRYEFFVK
jgi:murein DD-endopeptidase MepM/ murein hydrolase activator NlpD